MSAKSHARSIVWLRRDLRLADNRALYEAAACSSALCVAFVVDPILLAGDRMGAPLVQCFFDALAALRSDLRARGSDLAILQGDAAAELSGLAKRIDAEAIFYNEDYEPDAIARDRAAAEIFRSNGLTVRESLDHVYFGAGDVLQSSGSPYKVFTPYKRRWLEQRAVSPRAAFASLAAIEGKLMPVAAIGSSGALPTPEAWGFATSRRYPRVSEAEANRLLDGFLRAGNGAEHYRERRDAPDLDGTSHLSPQLRAGTIGIRTCVERAFALLPRCDAGGRANVETWISELIWRDFYQMVLKTWPRVATGPFVETASRIVWRRSDVDFEAWCSGSTGYPIVDAAMRQLNAGGWMHNRLRMIVASFLTKDLLTDWRRGERYFERHLADADLAQNNGGWQWSASTGTDAVPYFRIFSPVLQSTRFDPDGRFIRAMVPELQRVPPAYIHAPWEMPPLVAHEAGCAIGSDYPAPIVDHGEARARAIQAFSVLKG